MNSYSGNFEIQATLSPHIPIGPGPERARRPIREEMQNVRWREAMLRGRARSQTISEKMHRPRLRFPTHTRDPPRADSQEMSKSERCRWGGAAAKSSAAVWDDLFLRQTQSYSVFTSLSDWKSRVNWSVSACLRTVVWQLMKTQSTHKLCTASILYTNKHGTFLWLFLWFKKIKKEMNK